MTIGQRDRIAKIAYISDLSRPASLVGPKVEKKLVRVFSTAVLRDELNLRHEPAVLVPGYEMGRQDKFKLALIGTTVRGYVPLNFR